jgi:cellulose synthase/poly-beta-1,6-N-acetylglucosamine synthase-like glycosyltransferase
MWIAAVYLGLSAVLTIHTGFQFWLMLAARRRRVVVPPAQAGDALPFVTIQLPVYNERYIARHLLDAVARLDYPRDRFEIQVLDDSTDETTELLAAHCKLLAASGLSVSHVRRGTRAGYKAGALAHGLDLARGDLLLLLDADFMPQPDLLRQMTPYLGDPRVCAVQARWAHANRDASLLTRVQAFFIDVHFSVEQVGRSSLGCFVNFNGTAGLWRAAAIRDAGGWQADTLTEDLDLSYRAQLRGWSIIFAHDLEVPAELPDDVQAFRTQQHRWMKGVAQNARKLARAVLRARVPARVKAHALAHLFESSNFLAMAAVLVLTPIAAHLVVTGGMPWWVLLNPLWALNVMLLAPVYLTTHRAHGGGSLVAGIALWAAFLAMSMGMALHNGSAVLGGMIGTRGEFVRTPKRGEGPSIAGGVYRVPLDRRLARDVVFWCYLGGSLIWGLAAGALYLLWIPALGFVGLTAMLAGTVRGVRRAERTHPAAG